MRLSQIGELSISSNKRLEDVTDFASLFVIKDDLTLIGNTNLSNCCQLLCLNEITEGYTLIGGNANSCNNIDLLEETCTNQACFMQESGFRRINGSPNPCSKTLMVEVAPYFEGLDLLEVQVWISYQVVDMTGRLLFNDKFLYSAIPDGMSHKNYFQVNVAHLPPGMYGIKLIHPETQEVAALRFVKD